MIASNPGAYLNEAPFRLSSLGFELWPYQQTLDKDGKTCQGQALFYNI